MSDFNLKVISLKSIMKVMLTSQTERKNVGVKLFSREISSVDLT